MQNRNLTPFFWPRLVVGAACIAVLTSGCAAGGGSSEGQAGDDPSFTAPGTPLAPASPSAPPVSNPSATPPVATNNSTSTSVTPVPNTAAGNAGANGAGNENQAAPQRDEEALPPNDQGDADDDGDDDSAENAGDDDDDDADDSGDDADDDDDDGGDDDDDDTGGGDDADDGAGTGVTPPADPGTPPPADAVTFTSDIRSILVTNCGRCHASGGLPQFASANAATGYDVAFSERNSIVSEIRNGNMPADTCNGAPGSNGCVSVADFDLIQQWVAAGAPE